MAILSPRLSRICSVALLAILTACGGGGTGSDGSGGPSTGSLAVLVTGLPSGLNGAVVVSGPGGFSQTISASQTAINLTPGNYTITADNALSGSSVFAPQSTTQTIAVSAGAMANASVSYTSAGTLRLALQEIVSGLADPLFLTAPAGDPRLFIVERAGRIRIVQNGTLLAAPFLDIAPRVTTSGEDGLLSMAFDPQFASNGFFFIFFTVADSADSSVPGDVAIERFQVSSGNPNIADPAGLRILTINQAGWSPSDQMAFSISAPATAAVAAIRWEMDRTSMPCSVNCCAST